MAEGVDIVGGGEVQLAGDVEVFVSKRRLVLKSREVGGRCLGLEDIGDPSSISFSRDWHVKRQPDS